MRPASLLSIPPVQRARETDIVAKNRKRPERCARRLAPVVVDRPFEENSPIKYACRQGATRDDEAFRRQLKVEHLAYAVREAVGARPVSLTHLPLSWNGAWWTLRHQLDHLGSDSGGGIGGGPGISVGVALALKGSGRLPVAICGDGDYLMGGAAPWTAAHYRIPMLMLIANNRSFFNEELHQECAARMRNRPLENRSIGKPISDPEIDLSAMARAGCTRLGQVANEN